MDGGDESAKPAPRRRASKACLHCRHRKVRCDVTMRGCPCLNCYLDGEKCVVERRKRFRGSLSVSEEYIPQSGLDSALHLEPAPTTQDILDPDSPSRILELSDTQNSSTSSTNAATDAPTWNTFQSGDAGLPVDVMDHYPTPELDHDLVYARHDTFPFIKTADLTHLSSLDVQFMQHHRCFDLPSKQLLNEFVRLFFLHIHPTLPVMDESAFWALYTNHQSDKISLLVFQSIMFAASTLIPEVVAEAMGFDSTVEATTAFYKRAKILYDFEVESCPLALSQSALLLTLYPGSLQSGPPKSNSRWLGAAIRNIKMLRAHQQFSRHSDTIPRDATSARRRVLLRRVWWCCLIRDRTLSLGLHRELQIPEKYPVLVPEDFQHDIHASRVHTPESKQRIVEVFLAVSRLFMVLTDLLHLSAVSAYAEDDQLLIDGTRHARLFDCAANLDGWYESVKRNFPDNSADRGLEGHPLIIQTNLMYTYYFAAKLTLHHLHVLEAAKEPASGFDSNTKSHEMRFTVENIVKHLAEPVRLGLAQYLPVSVIAFAAMPLMINIINAKLMFQGAISHDTFSTLQQRRILVRLMKQCYTRLYGVDQVCLLIRQLVDNARLDLPAEFAYQVTDYIDLITSEPRSYIRLSAKLHESLSNYKFPSNEATSHDRLTPPAPSSESVPGSIQPMHLHDQSTKESGLNLEVLSPNSPLSPNSALSDLDELFLRDGSEFTDQHLDGLIGLHY